jgi:cytochrome c-type biogenesis protein CcmH/NrfG
MVKSVVLAAIAVTILASPASATPVDNSVDQVAALVKIVAVAPRDGGAYTELANAYMRSGRTQEAMAAYRRVLALDNVMLETPTGNAIWSHEVAHRALASTATFTSL